MPRAWVGKSIAYLTQNEDSSIRLQQAMKSLEALRGVLKYSCRKEKLNEDLREKFVELCATRRTWEFLRDHPAHGSFGSFSRSLAGIFLSNTDANSFLGMYRMHVLDLQSAARVLGRTARAGAGSASETDIGSEEFDRIGKLLDVGAGDGGVTEEIAPLFEEVTATEVSRPCVWRMRQRGLNAVRTEDLSTFETGGYDVVACFNVLDRCSHPRSLLAELYRLARPSSGQVLLAVVLPYTPLHLRLCDAVLGTSLVALLSVLCLPSSVALLVLLPLTRAAHLPSFRPMVEVGSMGAVQAPRQQLGLDRNLSWEDSVNRLVSQVLLPAGFIIESISRVPYLCQGDLGSPFYFLDDAIFVLRPSPRKGTG